MLQDLLWNDHKDFRSKLSSEPFNKNVRYGLKDKPKDQYELQRLVLQPK